MLAQFLLSCNESETSRVSRMAERVALGSVTAQKMVDEYDLVNPFMHAYYLDGERRPYAFNSFSCMNSYFCGRAGGIGSSFKTTRYYSERARIRRDELIAKVNAS